MVSCSIPTPTLVVSVCMRMRMRVWTCVDVCAFVHIHDGSRLGVGYLAYGRVVIAFSLDTGDILDRFVGDSIDPFVSRYDLHFFIAFGDEPGQCVPSCTVRPWCNRPQATSTLCFWLVAVIWLDVPF